MRSASPSVLWRQRYWQFLNAQGRRQEASLIADQRCCEGDIPQEVLHSLVIRDASYPFSDAGAPGFDPSQQPFVSGLAMARWWLAHGDHEKALQSLLPSAPSLAESHALRGRILLESQDFDAIPLWYHAAGPDCQQHHDYWATLGGFFLNRHANSAAAHCFLKAIERDFTDVQSYRRLAKTLGAMDRQDDAEQFQNYAILLAASRQFLKVNLEHPNEPAMLKKIAETMMELGRPFEALQWIKQRLPTAQHALIDRKRQQLLAIDGIDEHQQEYRLLGLKPSGFEMKAAVELHLNTDAISSGSSRHDHQPISKPEAAELIAVPKLTNMAEEIGIHFQWMHDAKIDPKRFLIHETLGGGIAVIDFDLDGWPDLYLGQGASSAPDFQTGESNQMYRNLGGRFDDVTPTSRLGDTGYAVGIASGDVNQDGFPDIFLGNLGVNRLFLNQGDGTFESIAFDSSDANSFTASVAIGDLDGDGLPDLYEANYLEKDRIFDPVVLLPGQKFQPQGVLDFYAQSDRWFRSKGEGTFQGMSIDESVARAGSSLGVIITDFDGDGRSEVFVGNDGRPNHLLHLSEASPCNLADSRGLSLGFNGVANACMGIATGDFNRDGTFDLCISNFIRESANLFLQNEQGNFSDSAIRYGLDDFSVPHVGFGTKANDLDRNGWLDLIIANGHIDDLRHQGDAFKMPSQVLMSNGRQFDSVSIDDVSGYWSGKYLGRTIAMFDYNRDHRMDFIISHLDVPVAVLQNTTQTEAQWVQFQLVGTASERDAIGARVRVQTDAGVFDQWVTAGDGYLCSDEPILDFGLGKALQIESVKVFWPRKPMQEFIAPQMGQRYLVVEQEPTLYRIPGSPQ